MSAQTDFKQGLQWNPDAGQRARRTGVYLADALGPNLDRPVPSQMTLARRAGVSVSTIVRGFRDLRRAGLASYRLVTFRDRETGEPRRMIVDLRLWWRARRDREALARVRPQPLSVRLTDQKDLPLEGRLKGQGRSAVSRALRPGKPADLEPVDVPRSGRELIAFLERSRRP